MSTNRYNNNHPIETLRYHYELVDLAKRMGVLPKLVLPVNPSKMRISRLARLNENLANTLRTIAFLRVEKATIEKGLMQ